MIETKQYLGDSVYVEFDGLGLILTTENGKETDPSNQIYLEPEVYTALVKYIENLKNLKKELTEKPKSYAPVFDGKIYSK
jgi:hypothetical protein